MSRHLPLTFRVPELVTVQFWPGLPSQVAMVMGVSLTAESPLSATHLFARYPDTIGPTGFGTASARLSVTPAVMAVDLPAGRSTATGVVLNMVLLPFPSCPWLLAPPARTLPSDVTARLGKSPAAAVATWVPAGRATSTGVELIWVRLPSPRSP